MHKKLIVLVSLSIYTSVLPAARRPCRELPGELIGAILMHVDDCSLAVTSQVSQAWRAETQRCLNQKVIDLLRNYNGNHNTALRYAVKFNLPSTAIACLDRGADMSHRYSDNKTPLDIAQERKSSDVVALLKKLGAKSMEEHRERDRERDKALEGVRDAGIWVGIFGALRSTRAVCKKLDLCIINMVAGLYFEKQDVEPIKIDYEKFCSDHIKAWRLAIYEDVYRAKNEMLPEVLPVVSPTKYYSQAVTDTMLLLASKTFVAAGAPLFFLVARQLVGCEYNMSAELQLLYLNITNNQR